jgi:hypothetical protein
VESLVRLVAWAKKKNHNTFPELCTFCIRHGISQISRDSAQVIESDAHAKEEELPLHEK